ncbi:MAG TPA: sulfatase [Terriglobia bacterium]|nr:sulfatase [Terriglobia bacterium]
MKNIDSGHGEGPSTLSRLSRREVLKLGVGVVGNLAVSTEALASLAPSDCTGGPRPNFVFFLGEGVRADELSSSRIENWDANQCSAMGNRVISTPHLDRIVKEGISFRNAFVTNALCLPSRATILTGLYSHSTGCIDNRDREIPQNIPTVADLLRRAGYEVAFLGKAHVRNMHLRNWDYYFGIEAAGADYYHPVITESEHGVPKPAETYHGYVDDIVTDRALAWLKERSKPFCLFLWFVAPHAPFYRPRRYLDLYNGVPIPKPVTFDDDLKGYPGKPLAFHEAENKIGTTVAGGCPRSLEELVKDHYAGVVTNDDCARRIFDALARAEVLDDTVILFSSDHGFFLGEWRFYDKRFMHEPSIRVPLSIRYPNLVKAGSVCSEMALNTDIAPTILDLAGLQIPEWMQGRSLVPFLKGDPPAVWRKDWLYEYYEYPWGNRVRPHRGIRTDRYKLIHYYLEPEQFELYDLQEDPGELHNLYGTPSAAELVPRLRHRIEELRKEMGDEFNNH